MTELLQDTVRQAVHTKQPLVIVGGGTKSFLGRCTRGDSLAVGAHRGIVNYDPSELVITARAGTPLAEVEAKLAQQGQMLAFEPPHFGANATLGGTLACNLSGPRRPYAGAARDFVLGVRMLNGHGEVLRLGGEVMKNVAGYDVSRLMVGAMGTLGVLLEISLKVLPRPAASMTLTLRCTAREALERMNQLAATPVPVTAACFDGDQMYVRLEGAQTALHAGRSRVGGDEVPDGPHFWRRVREHEHGFFRHNVSLWRLAVKSTAVMEGLEGRWFMDWGGGLRWYCGEEPMERIRTEAMKAQGHATLFRNPTTRDDVYQPLQPGLLALHQRLKRAFDPAGIFNRGRLYAQL